MGSVCTVSPNGLHIRKEEGKDTGLFGVREKKEKHKLSGKKEPLFAFG